MATLLTTHRLTSAYTAYEIEARELVDAAAPGQHVLIRFGGQPHRFPAAIADIDRDKGALTIVVRASGDEIPESVEELDGPFGQVTGIKKESRVLCVGEGVGVAALFPRIRDYKDKSCYTITVIAYPGKELIFWKDRFGDYSDELYLVTEDGSFGIKGPTRHMIKAVCETAKDIDQAVVIGSLKLLRAASKVTTHHGIPMVASLIGVTGDDEAIAQLAATGDARHLRYDWQNLSDFDGHGADYDELADKLGLGAK